MAAKGKNIVHKRLIRSYLTSVISISLVLVLVAAAAFFAVNAGGVARWVKENTDVRTAWYSGADEISPAIELGCLELFLDDVLKILSV